MVLACAFLPQSLINRFIGDPVVFFLPVHFDDHPSDEQVNSKPPDLYLRTYLQTCFDQKPTGIAFVRRLRTIDCVTDYLAYRPDAFPPAHTSNFRL